MNLILGIGISVVIVIFVLWYIYRTYNELTWFDTKVDKIASNLDAVLQRKYDSIPALLSVVKGYAAHESGTFKAVTELRSRWATSANEREKIKTANQLESALSKIIALQENYPKLKADKNFRDIQKSIGKTESAVMNERKYYNEIVRRYNVRVRLFPRNLVARLFGFSERSFFSRED
ncbi:LemA family protein [Candidatus Woesearchaeota archaeon]|nr:LemA family protein [Candidatus Woesearchaeota archaeon]